MGKNGKGKGNGKARRKPAGTRVATVPRFTGGFPARCYSKLRYISVGTLNTPSAVGSFNVNMWIGNLHDPDYSGVGHQPMYYDQFSAVYSYYRIKGFRYHIEITNGGSWGAQLFISHKPDVAVSSSSLENEMERSTCIKRRILPSASGMNHTSFSGYVDVAKCWGLSQAEMMMNDGFISSYGSGPSRYGALHLGYGMSGASTTTLDVNVELIFDVESWRRTEIAGS